LTEYQRVIKHRFPDLLTMFSDMPDPRQRKEYGLDEILMGATGLFMLKQDSRNSLNNKWKDDNFRMHYQNVFGVRLPHQDTVADVLREIEPEKMEQVKMDLMSNLFEQKLFRDYRLLGKYYLIVIDGTGIVSFDHRHCEHCLTRTTKNTTTYFHYVLEAKLITPDGHAISLATEWIENPEGDYDKQDCERKAFKRLAAKLKKQYPRLPVCILADGLYPYEAAFKICEENDWKYIFVLQDKSLKTVQEELVLTRRCKPARESYCVKDNFRISSQYRFQPNIEYHKKYILSWVQCIETKKKQDRYGKLDPKVPVQTTTFEYVTNIKLESANVKEIADSGRLRWKIENEGFNEQKCKGYELEHKFCRNSYDAMKNYYTLLQIAHAINQFVEKSKAVKKLLKRHSKETLKNIWGNITAYMQFHEVRQQALSQPFTEDNPNRIPHPS